MATGYGAVRTLNPWAVALVTLETSLVCLFVIFGLLGTLTTFAGGGDGPWSIGAAFWGIANLVAAALIVVGHLQRRLSPRRGTALLAIGAVVMAGLWYWVWMVSVPFAGVLIALAVVRAHNPGASTLYLESKSGKL